VLKASTQASPLLVAPQPGPTAAATGGRFFGRPDLATRSPQLDEPLTPAEVAAMAALGAAGRRGAASVRGAAGHREVSGAGGDPGVPAAAGGLAGPGDRVTPRVDQEYLEAMRRRAEAVLAEAEAVAAQRLAAAQEQVQEMLDQAVAAGERLVAQAQEAGYQEGYAAGQAAAQAEAGQILAAARAEAEAIVRQAQVEKAQMLSTALPEMVRLALAVAEHILHQEVQVRPEVVAGMVAASLAQFVGERRLIVRLAPADAERLQARKGDLLRRVPGLQELELVPDTALSPGDFHLQGEHGYVSAALADQLSLVAAALLEEEGP
jgi:flagellar assembly protein FliH